MQSLLRIISHAWSPWKDCDFSCGCQDAQAYCMWKWLNKWKHTAYSTAVQLIIHCAAAPPFIDDVLHTKSIKQGCLNQHVKAILMYTESTNTETKPVVFLSDSLRSGAGGDCSLGWLYVAVFWSLKINKIVVKRKTSEECNSQQNKVRRLIDFSDMANEEKAFSFHFCFHFVIVISR